MWQKIFHFIFPPLSPQELKKKYNLPASLKLDFNITTDGWYTAECPEIHGLFTQARSQQELLEMINDAILTYFDIPKKEADYVYNQLNINGQVVRYNAQSQTT